MSEEKITIGNLYELNKQLLENEKSLSASKIREKTKSLQTYFSQSSNVYFMLLCNDAKDYTLFRIINDEARIERTKKAAAEVIDCLNNRGEILSIEKVNESTAFEIWLRKNDNNIFCYYLFNYDEGVIEC